MRIVLKDVTKIYKTGEIETYALNQVDLVIEKGEVLVILGASGSGKSTMLNVVSGLDTPTSGEIWCDETCISSFNEKQLTKFRRDNLGFIFQQYNLLQNLTVKENIEMGSAISKNPLDINEVIEKVGLIDKKDKYPYQLSGGEQQRVSIARSVAKNPEIMFCDEPTGALDEETGKQVLELISKMNEDYHTTLVIITHNPSIAELADRVVRMKSGKIVEVKHNKVKKKVREINWA